MVLVALSLMRAFRVPVLLPVALLRSITLTAMDADIVTMGDHRRILLRLFETRLPVAA
jgi:hypothetical protein